MLNLEVTFQLNWPKKKNKRNKQNKKHSDTVKEEINCSKEPGWTNFIHETLIGANVYEIRLGFFEISRWLCLRHTFFICFRKSLPFFLFFFFPPQMGQFYYAAKAFDVLERLDPNPEYWEGKRGACVGIFQQIIAGHEPRSVLNVFVCLWEL